VTDDELLALADLWQKEAMTLSFFAGSGRLLSVTAISTR